MTSSIPSVSILREARNRLLIEATEIRQCLEDKKIEMFTQIESVENEKINKQQLEQKKIDKINALIEQTEELADNSLLGVQNRIITELQNELSLASIQESKCGVEFEWGFSRDVISLINSITLKRLDGDTDEDRTPRKVPSHPDGTNKPTSLDRTNKVPKEFVSKADHDVPTSPIARSNPYPVPGFLKSVEFVNSVLEVDTSALSPSRGSGSNLVGNQFSYTGRRTLDGYRGRDPVHTRGSREGYYREDSSRMESNERRSHRGRTVTIQERPDRERSESNQGGLRRENTLQNRERSGFNQDNSNRTPGINRERRYARCHNSYNQETTGFIRERTFANRQNNSVRKKEMSSNEESTNLNKGIDCEVDYNSIELPDNDIEDCIRFIAEDKRQQIYPSVIYPNHTTTQATPDTVSKPNILSTPGRSRVVTEDKQPQIYPSDIYPNHTTTQATPDTVYKPNILSTPGRSRVVTEDKQPQIYPSDIYPNHTTTQATPDTVYKPNILSTPGRSRVVTEDKQPQIYPSVIYPNHTITQATPDTVSKPNILSTPGRSRVVTEDKQPQIYPSVIYPNHTTTQATPDTVSKPNILSTPGRSRVVTEDKQPQIYPSDIYPNHTITQATPDTVSKPNILSTPGRSRVVTEDKQPQIYPSVIYPNHTTTQATPDTVSKPNILSTPGRSRVVTEDKQPQINTRKIESCN